MHLYLQAENVYTLASSREKKKSNHMIVRWWNENSRAWATQDKNSLFRRSLEKTVMQMQYKT